MEGTKTMAKKIAGEHEKTKFWEDYNVYYSTGEHGVRDWSNMATAWNKFVADRERNNGNDVIKYYRKHAHMLENFFESGGKSNNIKATLQPFRMSIDNLIREHRVPVSNPPTAANAPGPTATHGPNSDMPDNRDHSNMVHTIPLHMMNASVLNLQKGGPLHYPGQVYKPPPTASKKRIMDRAPQICLTCLHFRQHNALLNGMHRIGCNVPENLWNADISTKGWCSCCECVNGAESVGYDKPMMPNKSKRSLKTCNLCGHYKDHGLYKENHLQNKCNLSDLPIREKFQGYCSCVHCEETAIQRGQEKKQKLRRI